MTTPISGIICRPWARTCYSQPAYQMWSFYLHPLRRYENGNTMLKMGWLGVVMGHPRSMKIAPFSRA